MGTLVIMGNLVNHDISTRFPPCTYNNVTMVTWRDLVLQIVDLQSIYQVVQHISIKLMLVIIDLAKIALF